MSTTPLAPVQISASVHAALRDLAKTHAREDGAPRVTIRSLIEEAVLARWPELQSKVEADQQERAQAAQFDAIVSAVFGSSDPVEQNAQIEALKGEVRSSNGQLIPLKRLAYHLRSTEWTQTTSGLAELVSSYEQGN